MSSLTPVRSILNIEIDDMELLCMYWFDRGYSPCFQGTSTGAGFYEIIMAPEQQYILNF